MSRRSRARARAAGVMVLDNEGVSKAATDRAMYVRLKVAYDDGHRVLTSAAILAEILRGGSRDAGLHRVLARVAVEPVSEAIGANTAPSNKCSAPVKRAVLPGRNGWSCRRRGGRASSPTSPTRRC